MVILKIRLKNFLLSFLIDFICYNHVLFSDETGRFSIVCYDCFLLKPENYSMIELCFFSAEIAFPSPQALLLSDNRIVSVGELFVIDYTDSSNSMSSNVVLLEWDLNCILMKEMSSLKEIKRLKNESEICDDHSFRNQYRQYSLT